MAGSKISNTLTTLSSAAIIAIYGAGFQRTAPAAARFAAQTEQHLASIPVPGGKPIAGLNMGLPGSFAPRSGAPAAMSLPGTASALPGPARPAARNASIGLDTAEAAPAPEPTIAPAAAPAPSAPETPAEAPVLMAAVEPAAVTPAPEVVPAVETTAATPAPATETPAVETPAATNVVAQPEASVTKTEESAPAAAPTSAPAATPAPTSAPEKSAKAEKAPKPEKAPKAPKPAKQPKDAKPNAKAATPATNAAATQAAQTSQQQSAPQPAQEAAQPAEPAAPALQDGTYYGWGTSRHGDIQAELIISGGRIVSARISDCETRYPCSFIDKAPGQVVERQSPAVDLVAGCTQSIYAFYYAVVEALSKAN